MQEFTQGGAGPLRGRGGAALTEPRALCKPLSAHPLQPPSSSSCPTLLLYCCCCCRLPATREGRALAAAVAAGAPTSSTGPGAGAGGAVNEGQPGGVDQSNAALVKFAGDLLMVLQLQMRRLAPADIVAVGQVGGG